MRFFYANPSAFGLIISIGLHTVAALSFFQESKSFSCKNSNCESAKVELNNFSVSLISEMPSSVDQDKILNQNLKTKISNSEVSPLVLNVPSKKKSSNEIQNKELSKPIIDFSSLSKTTDLNSESNSENLAKSNSESALPNYSLNTSPIYPESARRLKKEGVVKLHVHISNDGIPDDVILRESSGFGPLDEAAITAVKKWRFKPAISNGVPVASAVEVPVRFQLSK